MRLTSEILARYIGGQLEVRSKGGHFCGEIKKTLIDDQNRLVVEFAWLAKKSKNGQWHAEDPRVISVRMINISTSDVDKNGVFHYLSNYFLESGEGYELGTFFPPEARVLDPKDVIGLQVA